MNQASLVIVVVVVVIISSFLSFLPFLSFSPRHFPLPTSHKRKQKQKQKQKRARCSFTQQSGPPHISQLILFFLHSFIKTASSAILSAFSLLTSTSRHHQYITTSQHHHIDAYLLPNHLKTSSNPLLSTHPNGFTSP